MRFLSRRIHLVGKIIISDVWVIHNRRNSKFKKENYQVFTLSAMLKIYLHTWDQYLKKRCPKLDCQQNNRAGGAMPPPSLPPLFCVAKRKKWKQKKKEKGFKAEIINRLSSRLKCYCFGHSRASRIQMVADNTFQCSMTPPLCHSNSMILINLKGHFITFINSIQATHIGFLIHTLGTLFKHVTDKYKTFAIILILGS